MIRRRKLPPTEKGAASVIRSGPEKMSVLWPDGKGYAQVRKDMGVGRTGSATEFGEFGPCKLITVISPARNTCRMGRLTPWAACI